MLEPTHVKILNSALTTEISEDRSTGSRPITLPMCTECTVLSWRSTGSRPTTRPASKLLRTSRPAVDRPRPGALGICTVDRQSTGSRPPVIIPVDRQSTGGRPTAYFWAKIQTPFPFDFDISLTYIHNVLVLSYASYLYCMTCYLIVPALLRIMTHTIYCYSLTC